VTAPPRDPAQDGTPANEQLLSDYLRERGRPVLADMIERAEAAARVTPGQAAYEEHEREVDPNFEVEYPMRPYAELPLPEREVWEATARAVLKHAAQPQAGDAHRYPFAQDLNGEWHRRPPGDTWTVSAEEPNARTLCGEAIHSVHVSEFQPEPDASTGSTLCECAMPYAQPQPAPELAAAKLSAAMQALGRIGATELYSHDQRREVVAIARDAIAEIAELEAS